MITTLLINQIAQLFLIMLIGFGIVRLGLLKGADSRILSTLSIYVVAPCTIINAFQIEYTDEIRNGFILALLAALLIHIILIISVTLSGRFLHLNEIDKASIIYSNAGNLVIPLVGSIFGPEWVIYSSAFICVQLVLLWSHGRKLICGEKGFDLKKIFLNFNLISAAVGAFLFFLQVKLPPLITGTMSTLSPLIGPLAMLITGMLIADMNAKQIFSYRRMYLTITLKMLVFPLLILAILKFSPLSTLAENGETVLLISLLAVITPSASTVTQMALVYDSDAKYAGVINLATTLVCIITMPLMVFLYTR